MINTESTCDENSQLYLSFPKKNKTKQQQKKNCQASFCLAFVSNGINVPPRVKGRIDVLVNSKNEIKDICLKSFIRKKKRSKCLFGSVECWWRKRLHAGSKQGNNSCECDLEEGCSRVLKGNNEAVIKDDEHTHLRTEPVWDVF